MTPIELTKTEFIQRVGNFEESPKDWKYVGDKPCIVDFHAPWCGYCKRLEPILNEFAKEYDGKLYIYKVNVDNEEELEAAFKIRTIPTLLLCRMDGNKEMMLGTMGKPELRKVIEGILCLYQILEYRRYESGKPSANSDSCLLLLYGSSLESVGSRNKIDSDHSSFA